MRPQGWPSCSPTTSPAPASRYPVPASDRVVEIDGLSVTAWHRIEPTGEPVDWEAVGRAVACLHELPPLTLPAVVPLPFPTSFPWWRFDDLLGDARPELDPAAASASRRRSNAVVVGSILIAWRSSCATVTCTPGT